MGYWQLFGIRGHYLPMQWRQGTFGPKLDALLKAIDDLVATGESVSLVGTSAGASAVLLAYAARPTIASVAIICGKVNHPETIATNIYLENAAFKESLALLQRTLPAITPDARSRILSVRPLYDGTVPVLDTYILGAQQAILPTIGHAFSIMFALIFYAPWIVRFLKRPLS